MALLTLYRNLLRRGTARFALAGIALAFALVGLASSSAAQQAATPDDLKAAFVFQFANYIQWPDTCFKDDSSPIVIGITGNDTMIKTLTTAVRGKYVGSRPIKIVSITDEKDSETCHILFIGVTNEKRVGDFLANTRTKPVLTVSDQDNFTNEGGVIRLFEKENKLRFEINVDESERARLTISSKLLNLADIVHDKS